MLYIKANSVVSSALESAFTSSVSATVEDTHDYSYLDAVQACHESALEAQMAMYDMVHFDVEMSTKSVEAYTEAGGNTELLESYMRPVYEGFLANAWNKIKEFVKKIIAAVIKAFKSVWSFLKGLYNKAKTKLQEWFKKKENEEKKADNASPAAAAPSSEPASSSDNASTAPTEEKVFKPFFIEAFAKKLLSYANIIKDNFSTSLGGFAKDKKSPIRFSNAFPEYLAEDIISVNDQTGEFKCKDAKSVVSSLNNDTNTTKLTKGTIKEYFDEYSKAESISSLGKAINILDEHAKKYDEKSAEMKDRATVTSPNKGAQHEFNDSDKERNYVINYNTKLYTSYCKVIITLCQAAQLMASEACTAVLKFINQKDDKKMHTSMTAYKKLVTPEGAKA